MTTPEPTILPIEDFRTGICRIIVPSPTLPPATTTNAWVLGKQQAIVVDPAAHTAENKRRLLKTLQVFSPQSIFLTHHHHDHIASAVFLREEMGLPIWTHANTAKLLSFPVDRLIEDGEVLLVEHEEWIARLTPGHAPGHLCLLSQSDNTVVAGDMVAGEGTILIHPSEGSIREYIHSLQNIATWNPSHLLPAHGAPIQNPLELLKTYIDHRLMRVEQVYAHLTTHPQSTLDLAGKIYTELPEHFLKVAAIQVQCGLEYLREECRAQCSESLGDTPYWTRVQ